MLKVSDFFFIQLIGHGKLLPLGFVN